MNTKIVIDDLYKIKEHIKQNSYVVVYLDYKILFGKFEKDDLVFFDNEKIEMKFIQKMRIFNKQEELYIWRENDKLFGVLKKDNDREYEDSIQVLMGTTSENIDTDWCKVSEELRGTEFILPDNWYVDNNEKKVALRGRNYIGYTENDLATYIDNRFVEFVQLPIKGGD